MTRVCCKWSSARTNPESRAQTANPLFPGNQLPLAATEPQRGNKATAQRSFKHPLETAPPRYWKDLGQGPFPWYITFEYIKDFLSNAPFLPGLVDLMEKFLRWSQTSDSAAQRSDALAAFAARAWTSVAGSSSGTTKMSQRHVAVVQQWMVSEQVGQVGIVGQSVT